MSLEDRFIDPKDVVSIKEEIEKEDAELPCNIWGYIKELKEKIEELDARLIIQEAK